MGVVATGDAFNVFVFLEISSLSTYVLIDHLPKRTHKGAANSGMTTVSTGK